MAEEFNAKELRRMVEGLRDENERLRGLLREVEDVLSEYFDEDGYTEQGLLDRITYAAHGGDQ